MKIAKEMKSLIVSGKWKSGFITPYNEMIVSNRIEDHERLLEQNIIKHAKKLGIKNSKELHSVMQKVILGHPRTLGYFRLQLEETHLQNKVILWVDTVDTELDHILIVIADFVPFYKYVKRAVVEVYTIKGKFVKNGYVPFNEQEGFSLNPRR